MGLEQEALAAQKWKPLANGSNGRRPRNGGHPQYPPAIKYLHIHECEKLSV